MTVRSIDHVLLAMPAGKEDEARAFYEGVLGIPELTKPANIAVRGGEWGNVDRLRRCPVADSERALGS